MQSMLASVGSRIDELAIIENLPEKVLRKGSTTLFGMDWAANSYGSSSARRPSKIGGWGSTARSLLTATGLYATTPHDHAVSLPGPSPEGTEQWPSGPLSLAVWDYPLPAIKKKSSKKRVFGPTIGGMEAGSECQLAISQTMFRACGEQSSRCAHRMLNTFGESVCELLLPRSAYWASGNGNVFDFAAGTRPR
jgi:hypothetical protein